MDHYQGIGAVFGCVSVANASGTTKSNVVPCTNVNGYTLMSVSCMKQNRCVVLNRLPAGFLLYKIKLLH